MRSGLVALAIAGSAFTAGANAQAPQPPIEAYGQLPTVIDADVSPDGKRVALVMNSEHGPRLVIYEAGKGVTKSADASAVKTNAVFFADNDTVIIRASEATRTWGFRGAYEYSAAIAINLETGKTNQLLAGEKSLFPAQGGLGKIVGRLDDGQLLMPAFVGGARFEPDYDLLRASLDSGRGFTHGHGVRDTIDWFVDRDGQPLIREDYSNRDDEYRLLVRDGKGWDTLLEVEAPEIPISAVAVSRDDTALYYIGSQEADEGFSALSKLNFDGTSERALFFKEGADIIDALTDINRHLVGVEYSGMYPSYDIVDPQLQSSLEATQAVYPETRIEIDSWADDRSAVLYRIFDGYSVPFWVLHEVASDEHTLLSYERSDIPREAIGIVYTIEYAARDGLTIPAVLTTPPAQALAPGAKLPMIVMPHGGPRTFDSFDFDWMAQYFANRGYLILQPNFRGSTGFGDAFEDAGSGEWGGKMQDDVSDGVKAMITGGYADPDRVCIIGGSYGGYSALAGGAFTPDLYKCVAAFAPVTDLHKMMRDERLQRGKSHWVVAYWERIIAAGDGSRDKLRAISPVESAGAFKAPVLLIHGAEDTVVDFDQSRDMHDALKRAGKQVELVRLESGDHWLRDGETRLQTLKALDAFIAQHLQPSEEALPAVASP